MRNNLLYLTMLFVSILTSCGDDDGESRSALGTIQIDNQTLDVNTALILNFGAVSPLSVPSHFNYDFTLTDAVLDLKNPQNNQDYRGTYLLYAELLSPGIAGFQTGTFKYVSEAVVTQADINDQFVFFASDLILDDNNDGIIDGSDTEDSVVSGTITVSGSGNNYTISYNMELESGKIINTSFSGDFAIF